MGLVETHVSLPSFLSAMEGGCTFPGSAKNAAVHAIDVNTDQIVGRAPYEMSEQASENEEKYGMKPKANK